MYVAAGGALAAGTWAASDAAGAWSVTNGAMRRSGMGQGFMRSQTPMTWSELRLTADATLPTAAGAEVGLIVRQRSPADDGYRLRLVVLAARAGLDAILEKVMGGTATTLAQRTGVQIAGGTTVRLELEAVGGRIEARVAGMSLLSATDPGPLPAGAVGLWGAEPAQRFRASGSPTSRAGREPRAAPARLGLAALLDATDGVGTDCDDEDSGSYPSHRHAPAPRPDPAPRSNARGQHPRPRPRLTHAQAWSLLTMLRCKHSQWGSRYQGAAAGKLAGEPIRERGFQPSTPDIGLHQATVSHHKCS